MFKGEKESNEAPFKYVIVASHERSGTHMTIDMLRANFPQIAQRYNTLERMQINHLHFVTPEKFYHMINKDKKKNIIKTHTTPTFVDFNFDRHVASIAKKIKECSKIVYICRDGRDVLASFYNYEKTFAPKSRDKTFSEFLRSPSIRLPSAWPPETTPPERWARHVNEWTNETNCLILRYEDIKKKPELTVRMLADYLKLQAPQSIRVIALERPSLLKRMIRRMTGVQFASTSIQPRKGIVGDWTNYFSEEDERFFWDRAGAVMHKLGYR